MQTFAHFKKQCDIYFPIANIAQANPCNEQPCNASRLCKPELGRRTSTQPSVKFHLHPNTSDAMSTSLRKVTQVHAPSTSLNPNLRLFPELNTVLILEKDRSTDVGWKHILGWTLAGFRRRTLGFRRRKHGFRQKISVRESPPRFR